MLATRRTLMPRLPRPKAPGQRRVVAAPLRGPKMPSVPIGKPERKT